MPPKIVDPLEGAGKPAEAPTAVPAPTLAPQAPARRRAPRKPAERASVPPASTPAPVAPTSGSAMDDATIERIKGDFRLFVILLWRHLLNVEPAPIMLDMAYWLQHGPDRSIIMAFRGFSKSWITGAYALWRLYRNPQEKILVVSGSLTRAAATTNWCLQLIMEVPWLKHLAPQPHQRQSSKAFDVGPATPDQSPSFHALGIGGQIVGFRGDCIIPDDVETQTNSLTVVMRDKIREAVKEFDSVLKPGGVIKYLGTPHDEDSLYNKLAKGEDGKPGVYTIRIWPARYPNAEQIRKYGDRLAPYILAKLRKVGPSLVGTSTMPSRFSDEDLAKREMSLGKSEFALQFMLDTSLSDQNKYPLKVKELMVGSFDPRKGPENIVWSNDPQRRDMSLPAMGFDGDYWHSAIIPDGTSFAPYNRIVAAIDPSGRGADETTLSIVAELHGIIYLLYMWGDRDGYGSDNLQTMADALVRYGVHKVRIESNFGDGMFASLFKPVLIKRWAQENKHREELRKRFPLKASEYEDGGTEIEEVRVSNTISKERRILAILEPVTQQHRLAVDRSVIQWDYESIQKMDGSDNRHRYSFGHQYTRMSRDSNALDHDDRIDCVATAIADFSDLIGVEPSLISVRASLEREEEHLMKLLGIDEEAGLPVGKLPGAGRAQSFRPQAR